MCDWINLIILTSFIHSSSCGPGSWRLAIPANSQKRLLYWSADYKYRLSITNQTSGFKVTVCVQEWCWCCLGEARLHVHWMDRGQLWWRENHPRCSPPWLLGGLCRVGLPQNMFFNSVHFFISPVSFAFRLSSEGQIYDKQIWSDSCWRNFKILETSSSYLLIFPPDHLYFHS